MERIIIKKDGNVGIGTREPKLPIKWRMHWLLTGIFNWDGIYFSIKVLFGLTLVVIVVSTIWTDMWTHLGIVLPMYVLMMLAYLFTTWLVQGK